ncbi:MAG: heavy metal translocating P-type ATPase [Thermoguttaceae bacterium]
MNSPSETCSHCGLTVPPGLVQPDEELQFCCRGCRTVYQVIHGCGLERFYRLRDASESKAQPARTSNRAYAEFDDEVFRNLYYHDLADGTQAVEFYLEGVHCAACVWLVEKLPQVQPGVVESRLDMRRAIVEVRWNPQIVKLSQVAGMLDSLGYPPHPAKDIRARQMRRDENRRFLIRIGVAAACMGNVMTLAFALYGGVFTGIEAQYAHLFRWATMLFGMIALAWPGSLFFRGAWAALRTKTAHLDLPIAIGLAAGGIAGTVNAILGRGEIYFDSLSMLVLLLLIGRWLQRRQQCWANDSLELLFSLTPTSARRLENGAVVEVPIEAVQSGDLVEVRAGDSIPADGSVLEGESSVDRALLTGESQPTTVGPGSAVHAGTVNLSARLVVKVEAVGEATRVGRLMQLVEQHSRNRPPIVQFADRIAGRFVRVVLAVAAMTFLAWIWFSPAKAVDNAVALLIVTCPCALGLATPLAVTIALGRAARRHILVKGGEVLEALNRPGVVLLDKTGTLTAGRISLLSWSGEENVRPLVSALERHSAHTIAQALADGEGRIPNDELPVCDVVQTIGGGITGTVAGRRLVVGSAKFVRQHACQIPPSIDRAERETIAATATPVLVAVDGRAVAVAGLGDPLRPDAADSLDRLRKLGWKIRILSGDHPDVVAAIGRQLGIDAEDAVGGASPEAKLAAVREALASGPVVMVGDGVNDAAALSAASVGIAVHGGAEASLAAAHVYLDRPGLAPILELMHAARSTIGAIHRCFIASICYNALAGTLAVTGVISPLTAAILMPISSFTVFALAYAVRTFGDGDR